MMCQHDNCDEMIRGMTKKDCVLFALYGFALRFLTDLPLDFDGFALRFLRVCP